MSLVLPMVGRCGIVVIRSLEYVQSLTTTVVGGAFLVNIKTLECLLVRSKNPYHYIKSLYRTYKTCKRVNASLMLRCAENIGDIYVLIPQASTVKNFRAYEDFPIDGYVPFKKATRGNQPHQHHTRNEESIVYRIRDSVSDFTFYTAHKPTRPRVSVSYRLKAMLEPHSSDPLREDKLKITRHINQILRAFISLGERNINSCTVLTQTLEREFEHLALDIEAKNNQLLTEWLKNIQAKNPLQLTA